MLRSGLPFLMLLAIATSTSARAQPIPQSTQEQTAPPFGILGSRATTEPQLNVWIGHAKSDDLARSGTGIEGSYDSLGVLLGLGHESARVLAQLNSDLEFRTYSLEEIDDEVIGNLDGSARIAVVPNRFAWSFRGNRAQGIRDPFAPLGPLNREGIRTIGSGPLVNVPLGARTTLSFSGEYSSRRFDESSNVDSDSALYQLGFFRRTSTTTRFGLLFSSSDVDYPDFSSAPAFQIDSASLRYEKILATGQVIAALGRNEIDTGLATHDEPLVEFEWARDLATRSNLSVRAGRRFTDSGNFSSVSSTPLATNSMTDVVISASPIERTSAEVSYRRNSARMSAEVTLGTFEDEFLTESTLDNDSRSARIAINRAISTRLGVNVAWSRTQMDFAGPLVTGNPRNEDTVLSAWVSRTLGRRFNIAGIIARYEREGFVTFDDRRFELRIGYSPTITNNTLGLVGR